MNKIKSKLSLKKKCILLTFLMLLIFFISFISFISSAQKHWNKKFVSVSYDKKEKSFTISFQIIDYEFGPKGEHAFFNWGYFVYSTDGYLYNDIFKCEVYDQPFKDVSCAFLSYKLEGSDFQFMGTTRSKDGSKWLGETKVEVQNNSKTASLSIKWLLPSGMYVYDIQVKGQWLVTGLYCPEDIDYVTVYQSPKAFMSDLNSERRSSSTKLYSNTLGTDQLKDKSIKLYKEPDAVVVKGVCLGENIQIYTIAGTLIKSIHVIDNVVKIELPTNQIYFVKIGQVRYTVAL